MIGKLNTAVLLHIQKRADPTAQSSASGRLLPKNSSFLAFFYFLCGLFIGVICLQSVISVFAKEGIALISFNENKAVYNGRELYMGEDKMVTVIRDGEHCGSNYMPLNRVLKELGYSVVFDAKSNTVLITD